MILIYMPEEEWKKKKKKLVGVETEQCIFTFI